MSMRPPLVILGLALLCFLAFGSVLRAGFIAYDDDLYVTNNARVQGGLTPSNVAWAFTTEHTGYWHPLTWLSLMLDRELYGDWPGGYHLTSLLIHALNASLAFLLFRGMTGALWRPALAAAVWAVHPLRVESVAWVAERKDVLGAAFGLLAALAYVRYARRPSARRYVPVAGLFALSLMAKPMLVTLPGLLLLLDYWPLRRIRVASPARAAPVAGKTPAQERAGYRVGWARLTRGLVHVLSPRHRRHGQEDLPMPPVEIISTQGAPAFPPRPLRAILWEKAPLAALSLACGAATFAAQHRQGITRSVEQMGAGLRLSNTAVSYARYLGKLVDWQRLAVFYPLPRAWPLGVSLAAAGLLLAVTLVAALQARRRPWLIVGWLWFVLSLLPVIGLLQVGAQAMADRYSYVPTLGVMLMLAWSLPASRPGPRIRALAGLAAAAVLGVLVAATRAQAAYWHDSFRLFGHALAVTEDNSVAQYNLGVSYLQAGRPEEAMPHFLETVRINPTHLKAHNNLGVFSAQRGDRDGALDHLQRVVEIDPRFADGYNNLGGALAGFGDPAAAVPCFERALALQPGNAEAHANLGLALLTLGDAPRAADHLREAWRLGTNNRHVPAALAKLDVGPADGAATHGRTADP